MNNEEQTNNSTMGVQIDENRCTFCVWAPYASEVYVMGTFNEWSGTKHPLKKEQNGCWDGVVEGAKPGYEYKYGLVTPNGELLRKDPRARIVTSSIGNLLFTIRFLSGAIRNLHYRP